MALGLLGLKVGMTQVYDDKGRMAPVTVLALGPCPVLQVRALEPDGYHALQLGFLDKARRKATRPERGHVAAEFSSNRRKARLAAGVKLPDKANTEPQRFIREFRLDGPSETKVGAILTAAKGFKDVKAVVHGLPAAHGAKKVHRSAGSISSHASNRGSGRPKKGHKAAGQYGGTRTTVRNLEVIRIDADNHLMLVLGAVPGPNGGMVMVRPTNKKD